MYSQVVSLNWFSFPVQYQRQAIKWATKVSTNSSLTSLIKLGESIKLSITSEMPDLVILITFASFMSLSSLPMRAVLTNRATLRF